MIFSDDINESEVKGPSDLQILGVILGTWHNWDEGGELDEIIYYDVHLNKKGLAVFRGAVENLESLFISYTTGMFHACGPNQETSQTTMWLEGLLTKEE